MAAPEHKSVPLTPALSRYMVAHGTPPDEVQERLIATTQALGGIAQMQIAPEQGALMTMLVRLLGAREIVEVGTFTGYSSLAMARGLPPDGHLLCCDVSEEWTALARQAWEEGGVADRVELRIGPAIDTLRALPGGEWIDMAFVDADKPGYLGYYEELLARLKPGGLLLADNVFMGGSVADEAATGEGTVAMRAFNDHVAGDPRVEVVMLPLADGVSFIRKR